MATPESRTLTITPSTQTLAWSGGPMSVGHVFAVTVAIPAAETWTFEDGHTYRLTAKRVGELGGTAISWWAITVTGERAGTIALDLSGAEFEDQIGSGDWLGVQWGVDDLAYGPMGVECAGCASILGNRAYRAGDTAPTNPSQNSYTDAEVDAKVNAVSAGAFDMSALDARVDALGDDTLLAGQEPGESVPKKFDKSFLTSWLSAVFEAAGAAASAIAGHLSAFAHGDIATNSAARHAQGTDQGLDTGGTNAVTAAQAKAAYLHSGVTTGNPHSLDATDVGADATGTAAGLMSTHTTTHPAPTTRDSRNEAAGTAAGLLSTHETTHPAPTTRDSRNEAAGTAAGLLSTHETTHPAPTTRDSRNEAALGNPDSDGKLLASTAAGVRSWVAPSSNGVNLSDNTPEALGVAAAGDGTAAARDDHVHAMPSAANVGADASGTAAGLMSTHETTHPAPTTRDSRNEVAGATATHAALTTGVHGVGEGTIAKTADIPTAYSSNPEALGAASAGVSTAWAKGDHVHPTTGLKLSGDAPTAHAASHITGQADAIQSATAAQNGLMTATQASKLDGIEASADVTDATNVAAAGALMAPATPAQGDVLYYNGSAWVRLPAGDAGKFLKTQGAAANPIWDTPSGGGGAAYPTREFSYTGVDAIYSTGATTDTSANCVWRAVSQYNSQTAYQSQDGTLYLWWSASTYWYVSAAIGTAGTDHFRLATQTGNYAGQGAWSGETLAVAAAVPLTPNYALAGRVVRTAAAAGAYAFLAVDDLRVPSDATSLVVRAFAAKSAWAGGDAGSQTVLWKIRLYKWLDATAPAWIVAETTLTSTLAEDNGDPQEDSATITLSGVLAAGDHCRIEIYRCDDLDAGTYNNTVVLHGGEVSFA